MAINFNIVAIIFNSLLCCDIFKSRYFKYHDNITLRFIAKIIDNSSYVTIILVIFIHDQFMLKISSDILKCHPADIVAILHHGIMILYNYIPTRYRSSGGHHRTGLYELISAYFKPWKQGFSIRDSVLDGRIIVAAPVTLWAPPQTQKR